VGTKKVTIHSATGCCSIILKKLVPLSWPVCFGAQQYSGTNENHTPAQNGGGNWSG
jgi:hypothetical protein